MFLVEEKQKFINFLTVFLLVVLMYVVFGSTAHRSSRELIGRYKTVEDLRDVFEVEKLSKFAKRLYVFEVCRPDEDCLYLITFDIKEVKVRDPKRNGKRTRKPTHEYLEIKEMMFLRLCGSVDYSTYICFEDTSPLLKDYLKSITTTEDDYKVSSFYVKPLRDIEKNLVREAITNTLLWIQEKALTLASTIEKTDRRVLWRVKKSAEEFLTPITTRLTLFTISRANRKLKALGIDLNIDIEKTVRGATEVIKKALEKTTKQLLLQPPSRRSYNQE